MSQQTVSFSVLLALEPDSDRGRVSERVAAVLGRQVDDVLPCMRGPAVRLFETHDEQEALRVTAALRMRELDVRCVQSQQWHAATRTAGARGLQLSDLVNYATRSLDGVTSGGRELELAGSAEAERPADMQGSPLLQRGALSVDAGEASQQPEPLVLRHRTTSGGLGADQQRRQGVSGSPSDKPSSEDSDPTSGQGAAVFRFARRTGGTGDSLHSKPTTAEAATSSAISANQELTLAASAHATPDSSRAPQGVLRVHGPDGQLRPSGARDFGNDELQTRVAPSPWFTPDTGGIPPSNGPGMASDSVQAFERTSSSVSIKALPAASVSGIRGTTSGGTRTIDFDRRGSGVAGADACFEHDEEAEHPDFEGANPYSDLTPESFGSYEDEMASVSALHKGAVGPEPGGRASAQTRHTTGVSSPFQGR
ncbi:MAG: hypothetical protein KGO50_17590, partial [Myxococcales bacterium]|nr:hypothetical protein [Myxococcales bacterium]